MSGIKNYLKNAQPIVYQTLCNAFLKDKIANAYIINGTSGSMVLPVATFIAQGLFCQNRDVVGLACEHCEQCDKISENKCIDYKYFEGSDLKKDQVIEIQKDFSKSAIEESGFQVYIVNLIENAPIASLNKLLKFIEEPQSNIVAIFTTYSLSSIIPTIISRCQVITLKDYTYTEIIEKIIEKGVNEEDANLIGQVNNNIEENVTFANSDHYSNLKSILITSLEYIARKDEEYILFMQMQGLQKLEADATFNVYLDMLQVCLLEAIKCQSNSNEPRFLKKQIDALKTIKALDKKIEYIMKAKDDNKFNANKQLLTDALFIRLLER